MKRVIGAGVQFQPMPRNQRDADIPTRGMDKMDLKGMIQKDEKDYDASWGGNTPSRPRRKHERAKMAEIGQQFKGATG